MCRMTVALENLGKIKDIPRGIGGRLECGGRVTIHPRMTKNKPR